VAAAPNGRGRPIGDEVDVPELCRFFGITIRMFAEVGAPHHRPHFHAVYQDMRAVFAIEPVECIAGQLPQVQERLVEAWADLHVDDLLAAWSALQSGIHPGKIEPLR
jgi:hypothetical protein